MEHCGEFLGKCEVKKGIPFVFVFCTPFFFFFFYASFNFFFFLFVVLFRLLW